MWCKHCKRKKRCLNVREVESPSVSSTTNLQTMNMQTKMHQPSLMMLSNQPLHISSSSSTASSTSRHVDSPSSSGMFFFIFKNKVFFACIN